MMLSIFSGAYLPSMCLRRNVCLGLCSFLIGFFLLSFMSCLYILDIESLSVDHLQLFSPIHRLSFFFFNGFLCCTKACKFDYMVSFAVQKLVVWFSFYFYCLGRHNETLVWFMSENVLPMFSSRILIVFCLSLQAILSWSLCLVWECVFVSLIYMQLSSFASTTC